MVFALLALIIITLSLLVGATLYLIINLKQTIMLSQTDAAAKLVALTTQVGKVFTEVKALKEAVEASGNVSPEVETALANLDLAIKGVDDLNEDAVVEPTEPTV